MSNRILDREQPIVSVVMPCYNASAYLREAIESVQSQTYQDWELLIIDDGSTDDSKRIAQAYMAKDKRIHLFEQPNGGACCARNNGIKHAKGKYIKFLDADDILCPNCLENQVLQITELQPNQIPFGDYGHISADGQIISRNEYPANFLDLLKRDQVFAIFSYWQMLISAPLHRQDTMTRINGFDVRLPRHQETDFHFRLALADVNFVYFPTDTFYYREYTSDSRITSNYRSGKIKEDALRYEIYVPNQEALLLKKFSTMPSKYCSYFKIVYFASARYYFTLKQSEKGLHSLQKAIEYGDLTIFMRIYILIGKIIGYVNEEAILQRRLKFLGKKQ